MWTALGLYKMWTLDTEQLRGIMGLMLFNPGRVNSNFIALQDT